jgi:hypothetical protein
MNGHRAKGIGLTDISAFLKPGFAPTVVVETALGLACLAAPIAYTPRPAVPWFCVGKARAP